MKYSPVRRGIVYAASVLGLGIAWAQPYRPLVFDGPSMSPTYADHEIAWSVPFDGTLRRGDVVIVETSLGRMVKRVLFLPGDRIPQLRVAGGWLSLVAVRPPHRRTPNVRYLVVPPQRLFVIGDNLKVSIDSRTYGYLPFSSVVRKVVRPRPNRNPPPGSDEGNFAS